MVINMDNIIQTIENKKQKVNICYDQNGDSPREWDNIGKMVLKHRDYDMPCECDINLNECDTIEELTKQLKKEYKALVVLPVYMYDHSGISLSTGTQYPFNCRWDSSTIGVIFTNEESLKALGVKTRSKKKLIEYLKGEVETYSQYLSGDVYGFELIEVSKCDKCNEVHEEFIDSCYGYYGSDFKENGLIEAIQELTEDLNKELKEEFGK